MNFTKALDAISNTDKKIKELGEASRKLSLALAAIAEIENGASISVRLECTGKDDAAEMNIDEIIDGDKVAKLIIESLNIAATKNYLYLSGGTITRPETPKEDPAPKIKTPEKTKIETPEPPKIETPEPAPEPKQDPEKGKRVHHAVNRKKLADMYFKEGKTAKEIAAETGLGVSTVFKVLHELRAEKEKAAKECVSSK
ncbi:MAG: hypothetical protein J5787_05985 [Alphaproteobacteria bacterium]|nr:hypothetical protein [Alphaproteobacteria bacterium]